MANERNTENLVRKLFTEKGYYEDSTICVEEQRSNKVAIDTLLYGASKSGTGKGSPEFIVTKQGSDLLVVIECKADNKYHKSSNLDKVVDYAVDGALHYGEFLRDRFNVIAIGVSGETNLDCKISSYFLKKSDTTVELLTNEVKTIYSFDEYSNEIDELLGINKKSKEEARQSILTFATSLHNFFRLCNVEKNDKSLVLAAILLALKDETFSRYIDRNLRDMEDNGDGKDMALQLNNAVSKVLRTANIPNLKKDTLINSFAFISNSPKLLAPIDIKIKKKYKWAVLGNSYLACIIYGVYEEITKDTKSYGNLDIIGLFYSEFLKYTSTETGIVLTPNHITELFCDIAETLLETKLDDKIKVLDTCTGSGAFLLAVMFRMIENISNNLTLTKEEKIKAIETVKSECLIGCETSPTMFPLACANMFFKGDGKSNLYYTSSLRKDLLPKNEHKVNGTPIIDVLESKKCKLGIINPPYSLKAPGESELDFIRDMLDYLDDGGIGMAIVPLSCAISKNKIRTEIMEKHTLLGVLTMPPKLFEPIAATNTCIMIFRAHRPHEQTDKKSFFGIWNDDGFKMQKNKGRVDTKGTWEQIKSEWLQMLKSQENVPGKFVMKRITADDEACAEAYVETDYRKLTKEDFERELKKYAVFKYFQEHKEELGEE